MSLKDEKAFEAIWFGIAVVAAMVMVAWRMLIGG